MYDFSDYGRMMADRVRMDAYTFALKAAINPDSVVLDIGAAAGIHALLACKFGARRVYAVETNEVIQLAREVAHANGYADRIEFIHGISTEITLPERVDLIVSDLRGVLPLFGQHIPSIIDARQRHLKQDGLLIPMRDTMWGALVEGRGVYRDLIEPWNRPYGLDMEAAKHLALNQWSQDDTDRFRAANLLTEPQQWATLDYASIQESDITCSDLAQTATRDGVAHGWLIWFDAEIADGIGFRNGPNSSQQTEVYGRAFFPLLEPISISTGDTVALDIQAELVGEEYIWRWRTRLHEQDSPKLPKIDFEQSTAHAGALEPVRSAK